MEPDVGVIEKDDGSYAFKKSIECGLYLGVRNNSSADGEWCQQTNLSESGTSWYLVVTE